MPEKYTSTDIVDMMNNAQEQAKTPGAMSFDHLDMLADALGGIPCWGALPGSPSAQAGFQYGDIVLTINGMPTPDHEAYCTARLLRQDGCTFTVWRHGEEVAGELLFRV